MERDRDIQRDRGTQRERDQERQIRERLREAEMKTERGRGGEGRDHASLESWAIWSLTHISSEQPMFSL